MVNVAFGVVINLILNCGDIFIIPYDGKYAVCKILWISKITKNVFSFGIFPSLSQNKENAIDNAKGEFIKIKLYSGVTSVFYTDKTKIKTGEWPIIGHKDLSDFQSNNLQFHNIGGRLKKGDDDIRALSMHEIPKYPKMLIAGYEAINIYLDIAFKKTNTAI